MKRFQLRFSSPHTFVFFTCSVLAVLGESASLELACQAQHHKVTTACMQAEHPTGRHRYATPACRCMQLNKGQAWRSKGNQTCPSS